MTWIKQFFCVLLWFGHKKRYLAIEKNRENCQKWWHRCHSPFYWNEFTHKARWVCDRCGGMGTACITTEGEWTIEHGEVVPDTKKWSNFGEKK